MKRYSSLLVLSLFLAFATNSIAQLYLDFSVGQTTPLGDYADTQRYPPIYGSVNGGTNLSVYAGYLTSDYFAITVTFKQLTNKFDLSDNLATLNNQYPGHYNVYSETGSNTIRAYLGGITYLLPIHRFELSFKALVGAANISLPRISTNVHDRNKGNELIKQAIYLSGDKNGLASAMNIDVAFGITEQFFAYVGAEYFSTSASIDRDVKELDLDESIDNEYEVSLDEKIKTYGINVGLRYKF